MSKISDIFANILKLDPSKEYEFSVSEQSQPTTPPTVAVPPVPTPTVETPPPASAPVAPPAPSGSTVENQAGDIAAMQAEIQNLKAANFALLSRLPIQEKEKSVEEQIYDLCVGTKKGETNAIHQTGIGTQYGSQSSISNS